MLLEFCVVNKKKRFYVLLDPPTAELLEHWCADATRDLPHTLRSIVQIFLADGIEAAEQRLSAKIWEKPAAQIPPPTGIPGSTPAERAEYIVTGKKPAEPRNERKPA